MRRVNQIETAVYEGLLKANIAEQYHDNKLNGFKTIFDPLNGKLFIRLTDDKGTIIFSNRYLGRQLGELLRKSELSVGPTTFTVEFIRYRPPDWNQEFFRWIAEPNEWFDIRYDRITMPFLFFFLIWLLFFVSIIWRYKAHLESDRLFSVLREFETEPDEEKLEHPSPKH